MAVQKALDEGRITPGMRDWATDLCRQNPDSFEAFAKAAPPAYAHLFTSPRDDWSTPPQGAGVHDTDEIALCRQLGIDPENLVKG